MTPSAIFLRRCAQIEMLLNSSDPLDTLEIGGYLRQLLSGRYSLVDLVNTNRMKLRFTVGSLPPSWLPENDPHWKHVAFLSLEDGLDPDDYPGSSKVTLNLKQFLKYRVVYVNTISHSVKNIIDLAANIKGAVHFDPKPRNELKLIAMASETLEIAGLPACIRTLRPIGRITLRSLSPLIEDVRTRRT